MDIFQNRLTGVTGVTGGHVPNSLNSVRVPLYALYGKYTLALLGAGAIVYANSFWGVFVFDDNAYLSAERLPAAASSWNMPLEGEEARVTTRPVVSLTLAVNHALGGRNVWGYHLVNLLIHLGATLVLFGVFRRTTRREGFSFAVALLWLIHPLQTESVTYIIQRSEALMGLFYLLTIYAVIRGWHWAAVASCALGMGSKGVMVTAPLTVLLYDRTFISGSFRKALSERWKLYAGLAASWLILVVLWLVGIRGVEDASVGFKLEDISAWQYARTQPAVILHYLRLVFWPHPLVLDYGWQVAEGLWPVAVPASALAGLVLGIAFLGRKNKEALFCLAAFFLVLAPTSSFFPIADLAVEHRMYLPLAAVIALVMATADRILAGRKFVAGILLIAATASLGTVTVLRNRDYADVSRIWTAAIAGRPDNPRAHNTYAYLLMNEERYKDALAQAETAMRLAPAYPDYHNSVGVVLAKLGRYEEALRYYQNAINLVPGFQPAHHSKGIAYANLGRWEEAMAAYREALRLKPNVALLHFNMAVAYTHLDQNEEAARHYAEALRLKPDYADAHVGLGALEYGRGRASQAEDHYRKAIESDPGNAMAHNNLAIVFVERGDLETAAGHLERALEIDPSYAVARKNLDAIRQGQATRRSAA